MSNNIIFKTLLGTSNSYDIAVKHKSYDQWIAHSWGQTFEDFSLDFYPKRLNLSSITNNQYSYVVNFCGYGNVVNGISTTRPWKITIYHDDQKDEIKKPVWFVPYDISNSGNNYYCYFLAYDNYSKTFQLYQGHVFRSEYLRLIGEYSDFIYVAFRQEDINCSKTKKEIQDLIESLPVPIKVYARSSKKNELKDTGFGKTNFIYLDDAYSINYENQQLAPDSFIKIKKGSLDQFYYYHTEEEAGQQTTIPGPETPNAVEVTKWKQITITPSAFLGQSTLSGFDFSTALLASQASLSGAAGLSTQIKNAFPSSLLVAEEESFSDVDLGEIQPGEVRFIGKSYAFKSTSCTELDIPYSIYSLAEDLLSGTSPSKVDFAENYVRRWWCDQNYNVSGYPYLGQRPTSSTSSLFKAGWMPNQAVWWPATVDSDEYKLSTGFTKLPGITFKSDALRTTLLYDIDEDLEPDENQISNTQYVAYSDGQIQVKDLSVLPLTLTAFLSGSDDFPASEREGKTSTDVRDLAKWHPDQWYYTNPQNVKYQMVSSLITIDKLNDDLDRFFIRFVELPVNPVARGEKSIYQLSAFRFVKTSSVVKKWWTALWQDNIKGLDAFTNYSIGHWKISPSQTFPKMAVISSSTYPLSGYINEDCQVQWLTPFQCWLQPSGNPLPYGARGHWIDKDQWKRRGVENIYLDQLEHVFDVLWDSLKEEYDWRDQSSYHRALNDLDDWYQSALENILGRQPSNKVTIDDVVLSYSFQASDPIYDPSQPTAPFELRDCKLDESTIDSDFIYALNDTKNGGHSQVPVPGSNEKIRAIVQAGKTADHDSFIEAYNDYIRSLKQMPMGQSYDNSTYDFILNPSPSITYDIQNFDNPQPGSDLIERSGPTTVTSNPITYQRHRNGLITIGTSITTNTSWMRSYWFGVDGNVIVTQTASRASTHTIESQFDVSEIDDLYSWKQIVISLQYGLAGLFYHLQQTIAHADRVPRFIQINSDTEGSQLSGVYQTYYNGSALSNGYLPLDYDWTLIDFRQIDGDHWFALNYSTDNEIRPRLVLVDNIDNHNFFTKNKSIDDSIQFSFPNISLCDPNAIDPQNYVHQEDPKYNPSNIPKANGWPIHTTIGNWDNWNNKVKKVIYAYYFNTKYNFSMRVCFEFDENYYLIFFAQMDYEYKKPLVVSNSSKYYQHFYSIETEISKEVNGDELNFSDCHTNTIKTGYHYYNSTKMEMRYFSISSYSIKVSRQIVSNDNDNYKFNCLAFKDLNGHTTVKFLKQLKMKEPVKLVSYTSQTLTMRDADGYLPPTT